MTGRYCGKGNQISEGNDREISQDNGHFMSNFYTITHY